MYCAMDVDIFSNCTIYNFSLITIENVKVTISKNIHLHYNRSNKHTARYFIQTNRQIYSIDILFKISILHKIINKNIKIKRI